jgi:hypothetical protein
MTTIPSLRRMWTMYKKLLVEDGATRRDQILAQGAFYSGARCVLKVLDHLAEAGELSHPVAAAVTAHKQLPDRTGRFRRRGYRGEGQLRQVWIFVRAAMYLRVHGDIRQLDNLIWNDHIPVA